MSALRAGIEGYLVDKAARDVVATADYPDYPHGSGHPIGRFVHDVGPALGPPWPERSGARRGTAIWSRMFL
ncbi:MAG TPA: M24 family metallopeptidase [Nitrososphaerales archaeon]|nr:M24 family metallopeptidase [Nitrososphaerales archaeon]